MNVGRSLTRREDASLITGTGAFLDDLKPGRVTYARFVRSSVAHARILGVDTSAARQCDGVLAVLTATDLNLPPLEAPLENPAAGRLPRPMLARDVARFVGEPIAVVVAESPRMAEDAAELVVVDVKELPVVASVDDALRDGAPRLHEHATNVLYEASFAAGNVDAAFAAADVVIERTFISPRQSALPLETRGVLAEPTEAGLHVHASTQVPHLLHRVLAEALDVPRDEIRVRCPDVGGGFGLKAHVYPEEVVTCAAARLVGRPVKWVEDRTECLIASCHARDQRIGVRVAADRDGRLLALDADIVCDIGAYGVYAHGHILEAAGTPSMIPGPYRLGAYRFRSRAIVTNKCPLGAYRGVGMPVATFVHERVMDLVATACGKDRAAVRLANLVPAAAMPYTSLTRHTYDSGDHPKALITALDAIGYAEFAAERDRAAAQGRLVGIGFACYVEYTALNSRAFAARGMRAIPGFDSAHAALQSDGVVHLWTTLPAIGQGTETTFAQLAADAFGVPMTGVLVHKVDTAVGKLEGTGVFSSRSATAGGGAIMSACGELRRRVLADTAELLEAAVEDLVLTGDGVQIAGVPHVPVTLAELASRAPAERYQVSESFDPPAASYPYGTHACVVEVDAGTGRVRLLRYVIVDDCGTLLNPRIVEGQVHGAVTQGIAGALHEWIRYSDNGQPQTATLMDYEVPTADEVPHFTLIHLTTQSPHAPHGVKGAGEGGTLAPGAAIANAISDALGGECNELPATPPKVVDLMRHAQLVDLMRHAQLASLRSTPIRSEAAYAARPGSE
jgi:carbon-monoxide dehydrogenase large subunit